MKPSSPATALGRIQDLAGRAQAIAWNDRDPDRAAKLHAALSEIQAIVLASRCGQKLPNPL